jgi:replicative DNA helicase
VTWFAQTVTHTAHGLGGIRLADLFNNEAEMFLLAAVLRNPNDYWSINDVGLKANDFVNVENRKIAKAIFEAVDESRTPEIPYVVEALKESGHMDAVEYLTSLMTVPCSVQQAHDYARIVKALSVNRGVGMVGAKIISLSQEKRTDFESVVSDAEGLLRSLAKRLPEPERSPHVADILRRLTEEEDHDRIPISFSPTMQAMTGGLRKGAFWVIGGFSSTGKSAVACNIAIDAMATKGKRIVIISAEMTQRQYVVRLLSILSGVPQQNIDSNVTIGIENQRALEFAKKKLAESDILVYDSLSRMDAIRTELIRQKNMDGVDLFILDYIQNITVTGDEVSDARTVALECQNLAKELDCPTVAFSQLSNAQAKYENEGGDRNFYTLKGHGAIRDAADVIYILDRDRKNQSSILNFKHQKNRGGPMADFDCKMYLETGRIEELQRDEESYAT